MSRTTVKELDKKARNVAVVVAIPALIVAFLIEGNESTLAFTAIAVAMYNMFHSSERIDIANKVEKELLECQERKSRD